MKKTLSQTIGANLKRLIKEKDLTQERFAEEFDVSPRTVRRWINEFPNVDTLEQLADFFSVPVTEFFK